MPEITAREFYAVFPHLKPGTKSRRSLEVARRATEVLQELCISDDPEVRRMAHSAKYAAWELRGLIFRKLRGELEERFLEYERFRPDLVDQATREMERRSNQAS